MMKKITICIGILFLCSSYILRADFIGADDARAVAEKFFSNSGLPCSKSSNSLKLASTEAFQTKGGATQPSFYAFNRSGGGYVIISAESSYHPVLAYSMTETFTENSLPDGYHFLLQSLSDAIRQVRLSARPRTKSIASEWENVGIRTKGLSGKCLETAEWGQGDPYNRQCPTVYGRCCVTGCVATAMAILLRYYKFPTEPVQTLTIPKYTYSHGSMPDRILSGRQYNFESMPLSDEEMQAASDDIKDNVACLLTDLGASVKMDYGLSSSGASSSLVVNALDTFFKYTEDQAFLPRDAYSEDEWIGKIIESIDNGHPVFYTGLNSNGAGHAFILDGYDSNAMMRFNFGWTGSYHQSFFRLDSNFPVNQTACFQLIPDPDNKSQRIENATLYWYPKDAGDAGLSVNGSITKNEDFDLQWSSIVNRGPFSRWAWIRPVLVSEDSRRTQINAGTYSSLFLGVDHVDEGSSIRCNIDGDLKLGDYIEMEYTATKEQTQPDSTTSWIPLNKPDDGSVVEHYPVIPAFIIDLPSKVTVGQKYSLKLKNGDRAWSYNTDWSCKALNENGKARIFSTHSSNWNYIQFDTAGKFEVRATVNNAIGEPVDIIVARIEAQ